MSESSINEKTQEICDAIGNSNYQVIATGFRDVGRNELESIIKIILSGCDVEAKLDYLYTHHPETISMDKSQAKTCPSYVDDCDCYFPDTKFKDFYCQRKKRERVLTSDKRDYPEYSKWRDAVFQRDDYTCQGCGEKGGTLNAHHIKSYKDHPDSRVDIENGSTLCESCHRITHSNEN